MYSIGTFNKHSEFLLTVKKSIINCIRIRTPCPWIVPVIWVVFVIIIVCIAFFNVSNLSSVIQTIIMLFIKIITIHAKASSHNHSLLRVGYNI